MVLSPCCSRDFEECSPAPQYGGINSLAFFLVYLPALTTTYDHWEDHSLDYMDLCWHSNACFSTHCLGLSPLSFQGTLVFWFHGCSHCLHDFGAQEEESCRYFYLFLFYLQAVMGPDVIQFSTVQLLYHVRLFATPWTASRQASMSIINSWSLLKLMSIQSVMPSNQLILCAPLLLLPSIFPISGYFPMSWFLTSSSQSTGVSASASVLPMNIQDWFPLGWTDWIVLQSKGLSRVFSNTKVEKHQFFSAQLSL